MTIYDELVANNLPVIVATETGEISMGPMTDSQQVLFDNLVEQYFEPQLYASWSDLQNIKQDLKDQYTTAINRLEQIKSASNPTSTQVVQAVQDIATYLEAIMKLIVKLIN